MYEVCRREAIFNSSSWKVCAIECNIMQSVLGGKITTATCTQKPCLSWWKLWPDSLFHEHRLLNSANQKTDFLLFWLVSWSLVGHYVRDKYDNMYFQDSSNFVGSFEHGFRQSTLNTQSLLRPYRSGFFLSQNYYIIANRCYVRWAFDRSDKSPIQIISHIAIWILPAISAIIATKCYVGENNVTAQLWSRTVWSRVFTLRIL